MSGALAFIRPATVDSEFGSTFSSRTVRAAEREVAPGSYIKLTRRSDTAYEGGEGGVIVLSDVLFYAAGGPDVSFERTNLGSSNVVSAATTATLFETICVPDVNPDVPIFNIVSSWQGENPSRMLPVSVHDPRLDPFFDRLDRITRGDWDSTRGTAPDATAVEDAKAVLQRLGSLIPRKVTAADGQIFVYFSHGEKFSTIEILSGGHMLLLMSDGYTVPEVTEVDLTELPSVIRQIRAHLA